MNTYKAAAIPADGIGPEVIAAGLQVLKELALRDQDFSLDMTAFDWGSERFNRCRHPTFCPVSVKAALRI